MSLVRVLWYLCSVLFFAVIPLTIVIWILRKIYKEDDGPLFYEQLRIGKDGKEFNFFKFRSMSCVAGGQPLATASSMFNKSLIFSFLTSC